MDIDALTIAGAILAAVAVVVVVRVCHSAGDNCRLEKK